MDSLIQLEKSPTTSIIEQPLYLIVQRAKTRAKQSNTSALWHFGPVRWLYDSEAEAFNFLDARGYFDDAYDYAIMEYVPQFKPPASPEAVPIAEIKKKKGRPKKVIAEVETVEA